MRVSHREKEGEMTIHDAKKLNKKHTDREGGKKRDSYF